ncbi:MAG: acylneuraminate cytidylyltransferase family protein [Candidatus Omnitrophica bacterium]|nr:acylneuraminate cytidylyltransferase family protein [Candidatus Omnitrophota bacterium]
MNILCVIPARGKSKRVTNKNIWTLQGKPLISHTIENALESKLCDKVVVSTDDQKIAEIAGYYEIDAIKRPANLALDTSAVDDALRHAVKHLEKKQGFFTDIVVFLQANVPIRKKGEIDKVIAKLKSIKDATSVVTVYAADQRPEWMKKIDPKTDRIIPFMKPTNLYRKQDLPELYLLDGAITAVKRKVLMDTEGFRKIHAFLGERVYPVIHDRKYSIEIDELEDIELAEYFLLKEKGYKVSL